MKIGKYQLSKDGPLTPEAISYLHDVRIKNGLSYDRLAKILGISQAFAHNLMNKNMNISTDTYMTKVEVGIELLKNDDQATLAPTAKTRLLEHTYHLRSDLQISLKLPIDLSQRESERLGQFIGSLAS